MDNEFKKLLAGGKWADQATDNVTPEDTSVSPALTRTAGFPSSYSTMAGGNRPDRRRINQILRELSGGAFELVMGVSPYDNEVDYPLNAITQVNGALYRATQANGPSSTVVGPTDIGQTVWEAVTGSIFLPEAPRDFLFDNSTPNELDIRWKPGRDGGSAIDNHDFQFRIEGIQEADEWTPTNPIRIGYGQYTISSLVSGNKVQARARVITEAGSISPWAKSTLQVGGNATDVVTGATPGGGDTLGLIATQSGTNARLRWTKPSDGGFPILRYVVQWRDTNGSFGTSNQVISGTDLTEDITGLSTGIEYSFRVAAENSQGRGPFSNIATLTINASNIVQPTLNAPSTSSNSSSITSNADWDNHPTLATATPSSAIWQWKTTSGTNWQTATHTGLSGYILSGRTANTSYDIRYQLITPLGTTGYSPVATVRTSTGISRPGAPSVGVSENRTGGNPGSGYNYSIRVTWTPPSDTGGNPIDGYSIRITWDGSSNFNSGSSSQSAGRNIRSASFGVRLEPGITVTALVQANNGSTGPWGSATTTLD